MCVTTLTLEIRLPICLHGGLYRYVKKWVTVAFKLLWGAFIQASQPERYYPHHLYIRGVC